MSRLALPKKPATFNFGGVKPGSQAYSSVKRCSNSCGGASDTRGGAARGGGRPAVPRQSLSSDSSAWDSDDFIEAPSNNTGSLRQQGWQQQQQQQQQQPQAPPAAEVGSPQAQQQPQQQQQQQCQEAASPYSTPSSELYDVSESSDAEADRAGMRDVQQVGSRLSPSIQPAQPASPPGKRSHGYATTSSTRLMCSGGLSKTLHDRQQPGSTCCSDSGGRQVNSAAAALALDCAQHALGSAVMSAQQPSTGLQHEQQQAVLVGAPLAASHGPRQQGGLNRPPGPQQCQAEPPPTCQRQQDMQRPNQQPAGQQQPNQQPAGQQQTCQVCGAVLSRLHYLKQIAHVKACMAGRGGRAVQQPVQHSPPQRQHSGVLKHQRAKQEKQPAGHGPQQQQQQPQRKGRNALPEQPRQQPQQMAAEQSAPVATGSGAGSMVNGALSHPMTIGQWLEGLGLGCYTAAFEAEEVEVRILHLVSADELAGIGVVDRSHQRRILQAVQHAADALGPRRARELGGGKHGLAGSGGRPAPAKKQRQLKELVGAPNVPSTHAVAASSSGAAAATAGVPGGNPAAPKQHEQEQQTHYADPGSAGTAGAAGSGSWDELERVHRHRQAGTGVDLRDEGPRPLERALLASLYPAGQAAPSLQRPEGPHAGRKQQQHRKQQACQLPWPQHQQRGERTTPQLKAGRTSARVGAAAASLWACAGACAAVAPTLSDRLAQREAADSSAAAARQQPLARGGTAYPVGEESRALKAMKLEALRQELAHHESTVAELRAMVAQLEREVKGG